MTKEERANKATTTDNSTPGTDGLIIRDARIEELNKVSIVIKEAYLEYKDSIPPENWKFYLEDIMNVRSRLEVSNLIVAEKNRHIAGTVTLFLDASLSSEDWPRSWAAIRILAVHPAYRGLGIGRALMDECIRRCREHNIKTLALHTAAIMKVARKMYEGMGFIRVPEYDFYPRPDTMVMAYRFTL